MHKMTIFSKNFGGAMAPLALPGYAYVPRLKVPVRSDPVKR